MRIDASGADTAVSISGAGASGSEVRGLVIGQAAQVGLLITAGAANVRVLGNFIGTNAAGDDLSHVRDGIAIGTGARPFPLRIAGVPQGLGQPGLRLINDRQRLVLAQLVALRRIQVTGLTFNEVELVDHGQGLIRTSGFALGLELGGIEELATGIGFVPVL